MRGQKYVYPLGFLILTILTIIVYWQFYFFGQVPLPGDTLIGAYFPWLDQKWGFPVGVPVKNGLISDVFSQFFIWKYQAVEIFKSGQIPLWNIYSLSGTPLMATYHSAVFNPFNILLLLPKSYGWGFYVSFQTLSAMFGMFLLLGIYYKNFYARIFGAVVFALSGLMTTWAEFGTGVWAASMIPWIFYFLEKFLKTQKLRFLFFLSLAFVILYLSGHAQLTLYSTILAGIFILKEFVKSKSKFNFFWPLIFLSLSMFFCAFQFLPTLEFSQNSIRAEEAYSSQFNYGLNPIYEIVRFFSADFFGNPATNNYWDSQSYHEQSIFLGAIPFICLVASICFLIRKRQINFWIYVFFATLLLGFENPISKFIYSQPLPFLTYSSGARIFFLLSFTAAILSSFALEKFENEEFRKVLTKTNIIILGLLVGIFLGFLISIWFLGKIPSLENILTITNFKVTLKNLIVPLGFSCFSLFLIFVYKRFKFKNAVLIFLIAFTFIDLFRYFQKYNPFIAADLVFPKTNAISYLNEKNELFRIGRADREVMPPNTWSYFKLQSIEGYDPLISSNYSRFFNLVNNTDLDSTPSRYRELEEPNLDFLNALNVKYLLSVKRDEEGNVKGNVLNEFLTDAKFNPVYEERNTVIFENPNVLARAYFAQNLEVFKNEKDISDRLKSPFNPTKQTLAISEKDLSGLESSGEVEILNYSPNRIEFKTKAEKDGFLVFSDFYDPGWKLFKDGVQAEIFQTNLAFRGLIVPEGESNFTMIYSPDSFKTGIWISLIALMSFVLIFFYSILKKKI